MMPENSDCLRVPRGQPVFSAETDISISENPNFRFYFVPARSGELRAEITDTDGARFTKTLTIAPRHLTEPGR
jgi:sulfur-oxidizing protein SoxY